MTAVVITTIVCNSAIVGTYLWNMRQLRRCCRDHRQAGSKPIQSDLFGGAA